MNAVIEAVRGNRLVKTHKSNGSLLTYPHYVTCNIIADEQFKKLKLAPGTACIYAIGLYEGHTCVIGETCQVSPMQRISGGYKDRIQGMKVDTAQTVTGLQMYVLEKKLDTINLYVRALEICNAADRRRIEQNYIDQYRRSGHLLLNRT